MDRGEARKEAKNEANATDPQIVSSVMAYADLHEFVDRHYDSTYAYCYRLSGRRESAEDLCQQVFVAAVKHFRQIRQVDAAKGWLATTARRMFWQSLKEQTRQSELFHLTQLEQSPTEDRNEAVVERHDWVHQALNRLTPAARVVVVMFYFEEKSYQQISQELEIPIGTVMSRLSRSKEILREELLKTAEPVANRKANWLQENSSL